jgi:hypothetical protein
VSVKNSLLVRAILAFGFFFSFAAFSADPPRIFYLCSQCDQYQMAYTEDFLTQAAKKDHVGIIKMGDASEYGDYADYVKNHPKSGAGGLIPIVPMNFGYDPMSYPKKGEEEARYKMFRDAKAKWADQLFQQFKRLDKTKPLVLHFGNHGVNENGGSADSASPFCMSSHISSMSSCLSYGEIGDLMAKAGLTGPGAPPVRIIGDHCFGGGVHSLAMRFPNVCSASGVSPSESQSSPTDSYGDENSIMVFGQTFWKSVLQEGGKKTSLASSYQAAWATIPKTDSPGGTLSSVFYAQHVMKWSDKNLPTDSRLPQLSLLERSMNEAESLFVRTQNALADHHDLSSLSKPEYSCTQPSTSVLSAEAQLESILNALTLNSGANIYREALAKAKDPKYIAAGKAAVGAADACWTVAKSKYDAAPKKVKDFVEQNGNWAWKNVFHLQETVDRENAGYERSQEEVLANQVLKTLRTCVTQKQPAARDYLTTLQTLDTLQKLAGFAQKATSVQKASFKKKVECESAPLL